MQQAIVGMQSPAASSSYDAALAFLLNRIDYERDLTVPYRNREFRLDRMQQLLARLGDPHLALPTVHIAGTKGKGSTAAMTAAILTAAGYRTGLFSSPHLHRVEERLAIDGQPCSPDEFVALIKELRPLIEAMDEEAARSDAAVGPPTYFEITTAAAILHFARSRVQAAVLEVGMGGRLDSTNVCRALVSVITSISFDHMKQLGNTLASIAQEKAGIIKPGVPVVSGVEADEPRRVIQQVASSHDCSLSELGEHFRFGYRPPKELQRANACGQMDFEYVRIERRHEYKDLSLGLLGRHQAANAAVALATMAELRAVGWQISEAAIRQGLQQVRWPARVEVIARDPVVIIDAAHNVASIESLLETLQESLGNQRRILIFATTLEKDCSGMLQLLLPRFDEVVLTRYKNNPRGVPVVELAALASEITSRALHQCEDVGSAWSLAHSLAAPEDLICGTGSFFLAAELGEEVRNHDGAAGLNPE